VVRRDIGSRIGPHFGPQSGENGSKIAVDGLGGVVYQSRCRRAVLYIVSEVRAQTGSRFEKPEVVFLVQEMVRNARICVVAGVMVTAHKGRAVTVRDRPQMYLESNRKPGSKNRSVWSPPYFYFLFGL